MYVIAIPNAPASAVSNPQAVANEVSSVAASKGLTVQVVSSFDQLDNLVRNPPSNVVVINAHGETVPIPKSWGTSWQSFYDQLASDISTHGWTFVSIAGYPFYWLGTEVQPIPPSPGNAGLQRILSSFGGGQTTAWCGGAGYPGGCPVTDTLTSAGSQAASYFGLLFPSSQLFGRAVDWKGISPVVIFYDGTSKGASAVNLGNGYFVAIGLPDTASDQLKADMGIAFSKIPSGGSGGQASTSIGLSAPGSVFGGSPVTITVTLNGVWHDLIGVVEYKTITVTGFGQSQQCTTGASGTCTVTFTAPSTGGQYTIGAQFAGDTYFSPSSGQITVTVVSMSKIVVVITSNAPGANDYISVTVSLNGQTIGAQSGYWMGGHTFTFNNLAAGTYVVQLKAKEGNYNTNMQFTVTVPPDAYITYSISKEQGLPG